MTGISPPEDTIALIESTGIGVIQSLVRASDEQPQADDGRHDGGERQREVQIPHRVTRQRGEPWFGPPLHHHDDDGEDRDLDGRGDA